MAYNAGFPYKPEDVEALRFTFSEDRFDRYLSASAGDEAAAVRLYVWNTAVAAAFYGPLQTCEVALRNAVHNTVSQAYGTWWFRSSHLLKSDELRMVTAAEDMIRRLGKDVTAGRVVAELGFAFWVGLFAKSYDERLWRTRLYRAFHPRPDRSQLHGELDRLRTLRNRIAHHEPIFQRDLVGDYERILRIVRLLSLPTAEWVEHHSRVYDLVAAPRDAIARF